MHRRDFLATGLAVGAGSTLLAGCESMSASKQIEAAALRARPDAAPSLVRLSANENPLGLGPAARRAVLEGLGDANRYPGSARQALTEALARKHGVPESHVQLGTGSSEVLQMAVHQTTPDTVVVVAEPTFEDVPRYAANAGRRVVTVGLRRDWAHDVDGMRAAAGDGPALVFLCNPNNPTGTLTPSDEIEAWIAAADERTTFVVDEAYFEFAADPRYRSAERWARERSNVIVSRTFSKIHGMAGLRLGYALARPETIRRLRLWACANNANQLALAAGLAALDDTDFQQRSLDSNRTARATLVEALDRLGVEHLPSHTNFLMHRIRADLGRYNERMRAEGFQVGRPFPPMLAWSRVSLGTPADMARFVAVLDRLRGEGLV